MMKIALIFDRTTELTTGVYLERVIKRAGFVCDHYWTQFSADIPREYDLYLRIDHGDYKYDIPDDLHPAVFYVIDTHLRKPYRRIKRQVRHYDVVFCAQYPGMERLRRQVRGLDVQWAPLGCDPEIHRSLKGEKKYDIGFVGRDAKRFDRCRHLALLKRLYPDSFIGPAEHTRMGEIYSASKIGFNSSIVHDVNMRTFEVMCSGCFLLTNRIRNKGFDMMFEDGKHLVTYKDDSDLLCKIDYYLTHEDEWERIARAGRELVLERYTYYHTVQRMFNYLAFVFGGRFNELRI